MVQVWIGREVGMSHEIRADYGKQFLFPPSLEDLVPADHPARFIREFVDSLDFKGLGFRVREAPDGRPNYAADLLLKVWLYGYFEGIRSTRTLEKACLQQLGFLWLTGMHYPDHNTLWRFYRDNRAVLKGLFTQVVRVAVKGDLVDMVLNAVDGTRVMADASKSRALHKERLEEVLKKLDECVDEVCEQVESSEEQEKGREVRLPAKLSDRGNLKEFVEDALKELKENETSHLSLTDKDARMMKCREGIEFAYNAQVVVDDKAGIIVAADVVQAESDNFELVDMLEQVEKNVGRVSEETVADGGYFSGKELKRADDNSYEVLVNIGDMKDLKVDESKEGSEFHRMKFEYDEERDVCICPRGGVLKFIAERERKGGKYKVRVYRCAEYEGCPDRWKCSSSKHGRTIGISPYHNNIKRQLEKQKDPEKQELMEKRKFIVEPTFGGIKHCWGFRRWTVRGLVNVRAQWYLICTTVNLRKMYKKWVELYSDSIALSKRYVNFKSLSVVFR
jgi:transposase